MEQITKREGTIYYGEQRCTDIDAAYGLYRRDYHKSVGRAAYKRLDRLGQRRERVHGYGFVFERCPAYEGVQEKVRTRLLGLVSGSYCRIFGCWDVPCGDEAFDDWFDFVFRKGSGLVSLVGTNEKAGRTSRRLRRRYR